MKSMIAFNDVCIHLLITNSPHYHCFLPSPSIFTSQKPDTVVREDIIDPYKIILRARKLHEQLNEIKIARFTIKLQFKSSHFTLSVTASIYLILTKVTK